MDNKNQPAFPVEVSYRSDGSIYGIQTGNESGFEAGLTKREIISATISMGNEMESYSPKTLVELVGRPIPSEPLANVQFWAEAEAKIRVIKADALLAELERTI